MKKFTLIIEDISGGKGKAFCATCPELNNSTAMGDNFKELFEGVAFMIEGAKEDGIGIFAKPKKKILIRKYAVGARGRQKAAK